MVLAGTPGSELTGAGVAVALGVGVIIGAGVAVALGVGVITGAEFFTVKWMISAGLAVLVAFEPEYAVTLRV